MLEGLTYHQLLLALQQFVSAGGPVLYVMASLALVLWLMLLERCWFALVDYPKALRRIQKSHHLSERLNLCCDLQLAMNTSLPLIKTLIAMCPLVGLLGTVTGMIQVFDVLAVNGTGNARLMSAGVAKATIPTMSGMVIAVSGLLFFTSIKRWAQIQMNIIKVLRTEQVTP